MAKPAKPIAWRTRQSVSLEILRLWQYEVRELAAFRQRVRPTRGCPIPEWDRTARLAAWLAEEIEPMQAMPGTRPLSADQSATPEKPAAGAVADRWDAQALQRRIFAQKANILRLRAATEGIDPLKRALLLGEASLLALRSELG